MRKKNKNNLLLLIAIQISVLFGTQFFISCSSSSDEPIPEQPIVVIDTTGEVKKTSFFSTQLNKTWKYRIYLPAGYEAETTTTYEVLYLLNGNSGSDADWTVSGKVDLTADRLTKDSTIRKIIIVMPDGGSYWYVDKTVNMESAIIQDLIPEIESKYRIKSGFENTSIGGLSMGGYGALRLALKYPSLFKNIILMSPAAYYLLPDASSSARTSPVFMEGGVFSETTWKGLNYDNYWSTFDTTSYTPHNFYLSVGTTDAFTGIKTATQVQIPNALNVRKPQVTIDEMTFPGGHEWPVWKAAVEDAIVKIYHNN